MTLNDRADTFAAVMRATLLNASTGRFVDGAGTTNSAQHATAYPSNSVSPALCPTPSGVNLVTPSPRVG